MNIEKMGAFLREERKKKNLSQKQLAEMIHLSTTTVCKWEKGVNVPDIGNLEKLAKIFQVSIQEILNGESLPPIESHPPAEPEALLEPLEDPLPLPATPKRHRKVRIAALLALFSMICMAVPFVYFISQPRFTVIRTFYPDSNDLGTHANFYNLKDFLCIIVKYSGNAEEDDFESYNGILREKYSHYFSEVDVIFVAYFDKYDNEQTAIKNSLYQSLLFNTQNYNEEK